MKRAMRRRTPVEDMRKEYDFRGGVRGKYFRTMQSGFTITIHKADGTIVTKDVRPQKGAVTIEPDVQEYFPDSESVNKTLRSLIHLIPNKRRTTAKRMPASGAGRRAARGKRKGSVRA